MRIVCRLQESGGIDLRASMRWPLGNTSVDGVRVHAVGANDEPVRQEVRVLARRLLLVAASPGCRRCARTPAANEWSATAASAARRARAHPRSAGRHAPDRSPGAPMRTPSTSVPLTLKNLRRTPPMRPGTRSTMKLQAALRECRKVDGRRRHRERERGDEDGDQHERGGAWTLQFRREVDVEARPGARAIQRLREVDAHGQHRQAVAHAEACCV